MTLTFARKSREEDTPYAATTLAAGVLIAWAVMFLRIIVLVAVIHPPLVAPLLAPMTAMGVAAGAAAAVGLTRASRDPAGRFETAVPLAHPFSLAVAVKFAALLTSVFLVVKAAQQEFEGVVRSHPNFGDRLNLYHHLRPLNFRDTGMMIKFRLEKSSTTPKKLDLFTLPALLALSAAASPA